MQRRVIADLTRALTHDLPRTASGVAVEAGWAAAHLVLYPLGALPYPLGVRDRRDGTPRHDLEGLSPQQRGMVHHDLDAARTPILLVHGIIDNHSIFTLMERALRRRGFRTVSTYDYGLLTRDIPSAAELLGEAIEKQVANTGYDRIHVVGHSLGGLIARYYVQRLGGDAHVHTLVTLGTPHHGTRLARPLQALPLIGQLTPQSAVIQELSQPAVGIRTRFVAFYSDIDHLIWPRRHARIEHPDLNARNIAAPGVGHLSMPNNSRIAFTIAGALRELDPFEAPAGAKPV